LKHFYDIQADPAAGHRWFLGSPYDPNGNEVDPRLFTQGVRVEGLPPLTVPIAQSGEEVDFNFCAFDMLVTPRVFNEELEKLVGDAIQRIPVTVQGNSDRFEILNICATAVCIDERCTKGIMKWFEQDGRPDKTGKYRMIVGLKVNTDAIDHLDLLRIVDWPLPVICSDRVKLAIQDAELTGVYFEHVS
jgi:hypothetical protein